MEMDQLDLLRAFNEQSVRFLVVGAYALNVYTEPRATKDLDVFIEVSEENSKRVFLALAKYGAPIKGLSPADFLEPYAGFHFGVQPSQIDILLAISGLTFEEAWKDSIADLIEHIPVRYISREHLIINKTAAGRLRDLADVEALQEAYVAYVTPITEDQK